MLPAVETDYVLDALRLAIHQQRLALAWIRERAVPLLESSQGARHLYRLPLAFALSGHVDEADAVFKSLSTSTLAPTGELQPGPLRERFTHQWASYPLTVLSAGAAAVGRIQESRTILDGVEMRYIDHEWGGALGERPEVRQTRRQDLFTTAQMGLAALMAGKDSVAKSATRWLTNLISLQPSPDQVFYLSTDGGKLIVSDPGRPDEAGSSLVFDRPRQPVASLGIGAALLAEAARKFHEPQQIDAAADLYRGYARLNADQYEPHASAQIGKRAWGACALYDATLQASYIDEIVDMVKWFGRGLADDGYWPAPLHIQSRGTAVLFDAEVTTEFLQHVSAVVRTLTRYTDGATA